MTDLTRLLRFLRATGMMLLADGESGFALPSRDDVRSGRIPMLLGAAVPQLQAAAEGDPKQLRRFEMEAYNGGTMRFWWSEDPVVVDLAGVKGLDKSRPIFKDHSPSLIVGHTTSIQGGTKISLTGVVSGAGQVAREVVQAADNGFPWQASIGLEIERLEYIEAGTQVEVNGQAQQGPLLIVRAGTLKEVSFVALGADDSTTAAMLAAARNHPTSPNQGQQKGNGMPPKMKAWLLAQGWTESEISALSEGSAQFATLKAAWQSSQPESVATGGDQAPATQPLAASGLPDMQAQREAMAAETERVAAIRRACGGQYPTIEAQAIRENWTPEKAELHVLRASRPKAPRINVGGADVSETQVLHAAMIQALRLPTDGMPEAVLQAAHSEYHGRIGLGDVIMEAARARGFSARTFRGNERRALEAAWSDLDMSGIFSNVANKSLLMGFMAVEQTWRSIARIASMRDFKTHTRYRMTGSGEYDEVGPTGEIKMASLGEQSFTNTVKTHAKMFALTRQDIINDDLGALLDVPRHLGRGAALKLNKVFWTELLDDAAFFTSGNANLITGTDSALDVAAISAAVTKFLDQTDPDGNPLAINPAILLVPNALWIQAKNLMESREVRENLDGNKRGTYATANPHAGMFTPLHSSYLSNSTITGNSSTAWYLFANPMDLAAIEVGFLDGQEAPTIEQADADFNVLGIQMRGFHDFGVSKQEHRAAVKCTGVAA